MYSVIRDTSGIGWNIDTLRKRFVYWSDLGAGSDVTTLGSTNVDSNATYNLSGTGAQIVDNSSVISGNRIGVKSFDTGTTTTGNARCRIQWTRIGSGELSIELVFRIPVLSTSAQRYSLYIGTSDTTLSHSPTDGVGIKYSDNINSGKFQYVTVNSSTESTQDSGVTVAIDTWYRARIVVNSSGSTATMSINGNNTASISTNLPATTTNQLILFGILKSVGTTSRSLLVDAFGVEKDLTR